MKLPANINWKTGLFTVVMLPVLISLGFWQLSREEEKRALQDSFEQRQQAPAVSLGEVQDMDVSELDFRPISLNGEYEQQRYFLLDNRTHEGQAGVELVSPFITSTGKVVLVNRGWLPRGQYRTDLPQIVTGSGSVSIEGNVHVPQGSPFMLGQEQPFSGWPRLLQAIDVERMYAELQVPAENRALAYTVRIRDGMPGAYATYWQPVNMTPEKHRGYAVQWFTMAAALVGLFLYSTYRSAKQGRQERENQDE